MALRHGPGLSSVTPKPALRGAGRADREISGPGPAFADQLRRAETLAFAKAGGLVEIQAGVPSLVGVARYLSFHQSRKKRFVLFRLVALGEIHGIMLRHAGRVVSRQNEPLRVLSSA